MTKKRTDNRLRVRYPVTPKSSKSKTSNAERCKAYRDKLKQDPLLIPKIRAKDIERARRNRKRPKSKDLIEHERQLNKERQKRYREKKKAESASSTTPAQVETRLDKDKVETRLDEDKVETMVDKDKVETRVDKDKVETRVDKDKVETRVDKDKAERRREAAKPAMQKRRANQHPNKKRAVRDKRMSCYYREKKAERDHLLQARREKAVQAEMLFQSSDCPYPTQGAFRRAVRRVKGEIHAKGKRFAFLFKGLLKSYDKQTKQELSQLHVQYSSFYSNQKVSS